MAIRRVKPVTNGQRGLSYIDTSDLTKKPPEKRLTQGLRKSGGRNNNGRITCRHRGGGAKRLYRIIDFKRRDKDGIPAKITALEYDPNRNARLHLLVYADGEKRYVLAAHNVKVGQVVMNGPTAEPKPGNNMELGNIPVGLWVHAIEMVPGRGAQMARSAGSYAILSGKEGDLALLTLPSGEMRRVHIRCRATIGQVGNVDYSLMKIGKAGRKRHMGRRPTVRGSAMNPVAHPMGGGEGRRSGGRHPRSKWGKPSKGGNTRQKRKTSSRFIVRGRKRGKQVGK
ncbi:MAG: 50S ribosomal protein L2 [Planctomycetota bacterium]|nr:50S ribosomal protein L2 [Planctomycetota bacterium]